MVGGGSAFKICLIDFIRMFIVKQKKDKIFFHSVSTVKLPSKFSVNKIIERNIHHNEGNDYARLWEGGVRLKYI